MMVLFFLSSQYNTKIEVFSLGAILNDGFVFFSSQYNTKLEVLSLGAILNDASSV